MPVTPSVPAVVNQPTLKAMLKTSCPNANVTRIKYSPVTRSAIIPNTAATRAAANTATGQAAELLGLQNVLGTVEKGKLADMVILDADPLEDITNVQHISAVLKSGQVVSGSGLSD